MPTEPFLVTGYHGTRKVFARFDPEASETEYGCFFADRPEGAVEYADAPGGRILAATLRFGNPYRCTARDWADGTAPDPADVAAEGVHDGYVVKGLDGGDAFIAWRGVSITDIGELCAYGTPEFERIRAHAISTGIGGYAEDKDDDAVAVPAPR